MAFVLHEIVSGIYDAYEALPGGRDPLSRDENGKPQFGNLEKARHAAVGKTVWMLQGGSFGSKALQSTVTTDAEGNETVTPSNYEALCRFIVWCWVPSLEAGWALMTDLLAAIRATPYGPNLGLQNFTVPTELEGRELHAGTELFLIDLTLSVPIADEGSVPITRVELTSHESTVTEDNGVADEDGDFTAFETVIVTGPPTP
jgi:hypothetical protein